MANKKGPKDDKLIQELYEKLDWFTFEATEEEFDPDQVNAIVNLLDTLDPQEEAYIRQPSEDGGSKEEERLVPASDPQAAFERFKKKYHITEEDLLRKNGKAVSGKTTAEKIVPFPTECSEELTPDSADVRKLTGQAVEKTDELPLAAGQTTQGAETQHMPGEEDFVAASGKADKKRRRRFLSSVWGKVAVALIVVVAMGAALTVGTSAVHQKSFFETIQQGANSVRIIVTGNEMESESEDITLENRGEDRVYYDSWEDIKNEYKEIMIPSYIPGGLSLKELYEHDMGNHKLYKSIYYAQDSDDYLIISVEYYENEYANLEMVDDENWSLISVDNEDQINYYQVDNSYMALCVKGKSIYLVKYSKLEEIEKVVKNLK